MGTLAALDGGLGLCLGLLAAAVGVALRARARRRGEALAQLVAAHGRVGALQPGLRAISGRWHALDGRRGLIEDDSGAALVAFADGHAGAPPADGAAVLALGLAGGAVDDPRGGYRAPRLPQLAIVDAGHFVRPAGARALTRIAAVARAGVIGGGVLFCLGLALAAWAAIVSLRGG